MIDADWQLAVKRHTHTVVLSLVARGVRLQRARELTQDTWALLYERHRAGLLGRLEFPGLAIRQAAFLAMKDGVRRALPIDEALDLPSGDPSPDAWVEARQLAALATAQLDTLSPRAREIYQLHLDHPERSHSSLAAQLGLSAQRFRQTLCEVRARLRAALKGAR